MEKFVCIGNCAELGDHRVGALHQMIEMEQSISFETMRRRTQVMQVAKNLGYDQDSRVGLTLKNDYHVRYHKSQFAGIPCYYMVWSAYEYVFVDPDNVDEALNRAVGFTH